MKIEKSATEKSATEKNVPNKNQFLRLFLWTIVILFLITITAEIISFVRSSISEEEVYDKNIKKTDRFVLKSLDFKEKLDNATNAAYEKMAAEIPIMVENIFSPAYNGIEKYIDFHYSIKGEYAEVTAGVFGETTKHLEKYVFSDLDDRMKDGFSELEDVFIKEYSDYLNNEFNGKDFDNTNELLTLGIADAKARMKVTASTFFATVAVSYSAKSLARALASKLLIKLGTKSVVKLAAKFGISSGNAAAAGVLCGPLAPACAIGAGVATWLALDAVVIEFDERLNREDFQAELVQMVDEIKADFQQNLEESLQELVLSSALVSSVVAQEYEFTLRELQGGNIKEACQNVQTVVEEYEEFLKDPSLRSLQLVEAYEKKLELLTRYTYMEALIQEIKQQLPYFGYFTIAGADISGNLPDEYKANRTISGNVYANNLYELSKTSINKDEGFLFSLENNDDEKDILYYRELVFNLGLEQHLYIKSNKLFEGNIKIYDIFSSINKKHENGLFKVQKSINLKLVDNFSSIDEISFENKSYEKGDVLLSLYVRPYPLNSLNNIPKQCASNE